MSTLIEKMTKASKIKNSGVLADSKFFNVKDSIKTDLPILNIAFSGSLNGGLSTGLTIIAGQSKSFKTLLGLFCVKAYLDSDPEAICLFYDSEFGVTPNYLKSNGIDTSRVIHIPIENVETLKFDLVSRLNQIERNDKAIIFVDSLGALASKKEVEDAVEEKSVADMSRAKAIRSLLRIITPLLTLKDIPTVMINHTYQEIGLFQKTIIPGGTAVTYAANNIFIISKSQIKDGTEIVGYNFTINIEKSRFVREKSKFPFSVEYESGIDKYSGLLDIAMAGGFVIKPSNGWYSKVDMDTGEISDKKYRLKDTGNKAFWSSILEDPRFNEFIKKSYMLSENGILEAEVEDTEPTDD